MFKLVFLILCSYFALVSTKLRWVELKPSSSQVPSARRDSSIGYDPNTDRVVIFGGRSDATLGDTWIFDLTSKTWSKVTETRVNGKPVPEPRFSMVYGSNGGHLYISTGEFSGGGTKAFYSDILRFNYSTSQWSLLEPKSSVRPEERYGSGGGIHPDGDGFFVTHGFADIRYSNTFKFDLETMKWEERFAGTNSYNPAYPHARCLHGSAMTARDELVLYGGCLGRLGLHLLAPTRPGLPVRPQTAEAPENEVILFDPDSNKWSRKKIETAEAPENEVILFDPDSNKWSRKKIEGVVPSKRAGHVMATAKDGIVMFGGSGANGSMNDIWLLLGNTSDVDEMEDIECDGMNLNLIMLHGILMFIGWGVLLQGGAFIARYFRHKDPWWFKMHRGLQVSGLVFAIGGFACAVVSVPFDHLMFAHGGLGLAIMIMGILQPLNAIIRPHKHRDGSPTRKRIIWEWCHKLLGRLALVLALINICLGLFLAVVPQVAWTVWYAVLGVFLVAYVVMELRIRCRRSPSEAVVIAMKTT
ncbi:predicted protein [Nematostella vectensis]|uniref:Cytochrome b561 domain-containing protein n=1 Tax=Nematostella vectensis TaxID=45351 RepID=A7S609_NEMVE|nr:predicted protein [Nematostella vectensis]|eukprot:XP_001632963.1 predicted protein [Nematostella vectensis]